MKIIKKSVFYRICCTLFLFQCVLIQAFEGEKDIKNALNKKAYKVAVHRIDTAIHEGVGKKGDLLLYKALVYLRDQEDKKAFETFLLALDIVKVIEKEEGLSHKERVLFDHALDICYAYNTTDLLEIGKNIQVEYSSILEMHPEYYHLGFIVAIGNAMLGLYDIFMQQVYESYKYCPNHFLVDKVKGILYMKLMELTVVLEEREYYKQLAYEHFSKTLEQELRDCSLYRLTCRLAPKKEKETILVQNLNLMLDNNIIVPRSDVVFFVQEAINCKYFNLAEKLIAASKTWYPYSRVINMAEYSYDKKLAKQI